MWAVPKQARAYWFMRQSCGLIAQTTQFISLYLLPFSLAIVLQFTQPISAALINYLFNGEKLSTLQWCSIFSAMFGVLCITDPGLLFPWLDIERGYNIKEYPYFGWGVFFALGHSVSSGFAYLAMRKMGTKIDATASTFHYGFFCLVTTIPAMFVMDKHLDYQYDNKTTFLMVLVGILGFFSQWGINCALALGRAGPLAALNYL